MGQNKGKGGTKVPTNKKKEVITPTRYFAFTESTATIDLATTPLRIKQEELFTPKNKDVENVTIEIWEIQGNKREKKAYLVLKLIGKVSKDDGFNFRLEKIEQDEKKFPKPVNGNKTALWMEAEIEVVGKDDKKRGLGEKEKLTFVLPPLEFDETLEFQLGASLPGSIAGNAKVTFGTFEKMLAPKAVQDKTDPEILEQDRQIDAGGNLKFVVVHCMCAFAKKLDDLRTSDTTEVELAGDKPSRCFEVDLNLEIFKRRRVSAHFLIDRDGNIVKAIDVDLQARHAYSPANVHFKSANQLSIGIELLGFADDFRKIAEDEFADEKKNKLKKEKETLEAALARRKAEKAAGVKEVKVGKEKMTIDEAISRIEKAIAEKDTEIATTPYSARGADYEKLFAAKGPDGVPDCFRYTDKQYAALGKLLETLGKRYAYQYVCSHHYIIPAKKKDPGKHFDWGKLTPYLLPGSLAGDESGSGGLYTVKI